MRSSYERIDFFIDEPNFLRNIHIFKKNSVMYRGKSIFHNLMSSVSLRLDDREAYMHTSEGGNGDRKRV